MMYGDLEHFSQIPSKIVVKIYSSLSSFNDVDALAATCSRFRQIWLVNAGSIYHVLAPKNIQCEYYARIFLEDMGGSSKKCLVLFLDDVRSMIRYARLSERAIGQFEQEPVCRVQSRVSPY